MKPLVSFHGYLLGKILNYLRASEGYHTETAIYTLDGIKAVVQDSFGFRYEIQIKTVGRISDNLEGFDDIIKQDKAASVSLPIFKG